MTYELSNLKRKQELKKIKLKGKNPDELKDLLIKFSHGLAESLYKKYHRSPRLHILLPEVGDYQSLVYQAILKTVDIYDYFKWKREGDQKAKARIKEWRNGHGQEFLPRNKAHKFQHLGHLYGYMFLSAENMVKMSIESLTLVKRNGMEVYPSQIKTQDSEVSSSFMDLILGPADNSSSEDKLFHDEIMSKLSNLKILKRGGNHHTYQELYYLHYVEECNAREISKKVGYSPGQVLFHIEKLNEMLERILTERMVA